MPREENVSVLKAACAVSALTLYKSTHKNRPFFLLYVQVYSTHNTTKCEQNLVGHVFKIPVSGIIIRTRTCMGPKSGLQILRKNEPSVDKTKDILCLVLVNRDYGIESRDNLEI